jgi:poly(A) polymerase/tRNA nucleotidyltransferase (CCA-adding enzyme)
MNNMQRVPITVSNLALLILKYLTDAGFEAYIVGGAVRDLLLSTETTDYDFTTSAKPEEILKIFPEAFYENDFGTVMLTASDAEIQFGVKSASNLELDQLQTSNRIIDLANAHKIHISLQSNLHNPQSDNQLNDRNFEITTFRSDDAYSDFRRPDKVSWGSSLKEDLERRDFTINAMAIVVDSKLLSDFDPDQNDLITLNPDQYQIIDEHHGFEDLSQGIIRTVGDPDQRFQEDALRMLRAIRLAVQLNMTIDPATLQSIKTHAHLLEHISWERISTEFLKMLKSSQPKKAIHLLDETGLLQLVLPELLDAKGVDQSGHHTTDVWTHSLDALEACPSSDPVVRLATLLHDIGKPTTQLKQGDKFTFYNHEVIGARIAKNISARLKLSRKDQDRVFVLVRQHMFHYQPQNTDSSIRRFMRNVGLENIDDILDLREADRLGSGARRTSWRLEEMKERMISQLNQPMEVRDLAINGDDLMKEFNLKPGPILGKILNHLFEIVLENPEFNEKVKLISLAQDFLDLDLANSSSQTTNSGAATNVEE